MTDQIPKAYEKLIDKAKEINLVGSSCAILEWDTNCYLPQGAFSYRGEQVAFLSAWVHREFTSNEFEKLLSEAEEETDTSDPLDVKSVNLKHIRRDFDRAKKVPEDLVKRLSKESTLADRSWRKAREEKDFSVFMPNLQNLVSLTKEKAHAIGVETTPYETLIDIFEPGATVEWLNEVFNPLKESLISLTARIGESSKLDRSFLLNKKFEAGKEAEICRRVSSAMGFDYSAGRIDTTIHPFCTTLGPKDVRIITKYQEDNLCFTIFATIHETGHGLYDQGLPTEEYGLPAGEAVSFGIHESQSLIWEKLIARNRSFLEYLFPIIKEYFHNQFSNVDVERFYRAVNYAEPSLIRVMADEVTYNLHIIIRFEIEQMLINEDFSVKDIPELWNSKYKDYLGITPPDDTLGCMQDVHWSNGAFGYFPSYTLGYLYASQFYNKANEELGDLPELLRKGNFTPMLEWLRRNIHVQGRRYDARELVEKVTGKPFSHKYFVDYLENKYSELYNI